MKMIKLTEKRDDDPSPVKLILTLGVAGLLSGLAIVGIYEATLPTITAYKAKVLREAVFKVLPGTTRIEKLHYADGCLQASTSEQDDSIYAGYDSKEALVGYAITAEGPGFQDIIGLLYGYLPDKRVIVGMEVLESRETPGLGDKIYKDADFIANFLELAVDPTIVMVKKGRKSAPNEVDAISGATISSKAVVRIINESNEKWLEKLSINCEPLSK
ncbi:MAG: FMN-binding protein [Pseudomonadota bacterium]